MNKKIYLPLLDIENVLPILNKTAIFGGLTDAQLYTVFRCLQVVEYRMGEIIFRKVISLRTFDFFMRETKARIVWGRYEGEKEFTDDQQ